MVPNNPVSFFVIKTANSKKCPVLFSHFGLCIKKKDYNRINLGSCRIFEGLERSGSAETPLFPVSI